VVKAARLIRIVVLLAAALAAMAATGGSAFAQIVAANVTITPNNGPLGGGTAITISGTHFTDGVLGPSVADVRVGGTSIGFTLINNQTITATTPAKSAGGQTVEVIFNGTGCVITNCEETGTFTYVAPATVTSVTPNSGTTLGGTSVFISGTSFSTATSVTFGGASPTSSVVVNDTTIQAMTPAHAAGVVDIVIVNAGGTGTGTGLYTYVLPPAPTITNISPTSGSTTGGTSVTITGTNLGGATSVTFAGSSAAFTITDGSHISAITPPGSLGAADVSVNTPSGTVTATGGYTYTTPPPTITSISPTSGSVSGGTFVTITGSHLTGATAVTIGGTPVTSFTVASASAITATTAAHVAGTVDVVVTTPTGTGTGTGLYTYGTPPPTVTAVSPTSGLTTGATSVTITGASFTGATAVTFGGTAAASFVVNSNTSITATTPAHAAGPVDVAVTTPIGTGTGFGLYTYTPPPPVVTSVAPPSGLTTGGTAITITGQRFTGVVQVKVGGFAATGMTVVNDTTITATTPAGTAGAADVVVISPLGTGTGTGLFTYVAPPGGVTPAPTVTGIAPANGSTAGGTVVTITGTDFVVGASTVTIGGNPATGVTVVNATTITATTPAHAAGAVDVAVTTPNGTGTGVGLYTYTAAGPTVSTISPANGPIAGGTSVTITGANFVTGSTSVTFDGVAATGVNVVNGTTLTATSPAHAAAAVNVVVTTPGGASGALVFTYLSFAPSVTTINPSSGPTTGGTAVTITGTNFSGASAVRFGGDNARSYTVVSATQITATSPAHSLGAVYVQVTTASGTSASSAGAQFTYAVPADSQKLRTLQTTVTPLVAQVSGQAFTSAVESAVAAGLSGSPQTLTPNGSGFTYYFDDNPAGQTGAASDGSVRDFVAAPDHAANRIDGDFSALGYKGARLAPRPSVTPARDWLAWIDFRSTSSVKHGTDDIHGPQTNAIAGLTRRVTPDILVGMLGGYEYFNYSSDALSGRLTGSGWTVGTYVGAKLGMGLRFDAAIGYSDIAYDGTAGTASGTFTGTRWLTSGGLTGTYGWNGLTFEPSARLYGLWESEKAYTDSLGTLQADRKFSTGRASGGSKVIFASISVPYATVTPYVGLYGDYYFLSDDASAAALGSTALLHGWSARATTGVTMNFDHGMQLGVGGEVGGLGSDTMIWGLRLTGKISF
jgi:hypothetical protein